MSVSTLVPRTVKRSIQYTCPSCSVRIRWKQQAALQLRAHQKRGFLGIMLGLKEPPPEFVPKRLDKPLGLPLPPRSGENTGIDPRGWRQRRDDFFNYDKHLERRKELTKQVLKPYYRDQSNLRWRRGKSFLQPAALLKASRALYFPNLRGQTLVSQPNENEDGETDTTPIIEGHVSVVAVFSGQWAQEQTATFVSQEKNPELWRILAANRGNAQLVQLNVEDNKMRSTLVRMSMPRLRKIIPKEHHGSYFLVKRGFTEDLREAIGYTNSKVGYVFLIDRECKIRWAASADAEEGEVDWLNKAFGRLLKGDST